MEINASDFKARCLAILDEVAERGLSLIILKRGKPVAELRPVSKKAGQYSQLELLGTVKILGDVVSPVLPSKELKFEKDLI